MESESRPVWQCKYNPSFRLQSTQISFLLRRRVTRQHCRLGVTKTLRTNVKFDAIKEKQQDSQHIKRKNKKSSNPLTE